MISFYFKTGFFLSCFLTCLNFVFAEEESGSGSNLTPLEEVVIDLQQTQTGIILETNTQDQQSDSIEITLNQTSISTGSNVVAASGSAAQITSGAIVNEETEQSEEASILLNEIMINPLEGKEWIEIYNPTEIEINLTGFQIADAVKTRYTFEDNALICAKGFITVDFYNVLNNSGDQVYLKNIDSEVVDFVSYGESDDLFQTIAKGESLGRSPDGSESWVLFSAAEVSKEFANFTQATKDPAKPAEEEITEEEDILTQLYLNEIMINPLEGKEWVELYNPTEARINLANLTLSDEVSIRHTFEEIDFVEKKDFVVVEFYNIFNNSGDRIYLKNAEGAILDQFSYGEEEIFTTITKGSSVGRFPDGNERWRSYASDQTTKASQNMVYYNATMPEVVIEINVQSGALLLSWEDVKEDDFGGYQIYQNKLGSGFILLDQFSKNSFEIQNLEKGKVYEYLLKVCNLEGNCSDETQSKQALITDFLGLQINEFLANVKGNDEGNEWIELFYSGSGSLILNDYYLEIDEKKRINLVDFNFIDNENFLTLDPSLFNVSLKNSNGKIALKKDGVNSAIDEFAYLTAQDDVSWWRNLETNAWEESYRPTRNAKNILQNNLPQAVITMQGTGRTSGEGSLSVNVTAENSQDPDGDNFTCFWDYGDGNFSDKCNPPAHKYDVGQFELKLSITDMLGGSSFISQHITVKPKKSVGGNSPHSSRPEPVENLSYSDQIKLHRFLANPQGKDKGKEWIEIINLGTETINLDWWQLDDKEGGSKPYFIPINSWIEPQEILRFSSLKTGLNLNNKEDEVRLISPDLEIRDNIVYSQAKDSAVYQRMSDQQWRWIQPTKKAKENKKNEAEIIPKLEQATKQFVQNFDFSLIELSEILPSSTLGDKNNEWIEIYNKGTESFDLGGWSLDDVLNKGSKAYLFPQGTKIQAQDFLLIYSSESGIALNNGGDSVHLINHDGIIQESFTYNRVKKDHSWKKNQKGNFVLSQFVTPGKQNLLYPSLKKQDQDQDGLLDQDEINLYKTDPQKNDTDEDGIPDGFEIYNGLNPLKKNVGQELYLDYLQSSTKASLKKADNKKLSIEGLAEPGAFVKIFIHSKLIVGFAQADQAGHWHYAIPKELESGEHHVATEIITKTGFKTKKQTVFKFELDDPYQPTQTSTAIKFVAVVPNPEGRDSLNEYFSIKNFDTIPVNLEGWKIVSQKNEKTIFPEIWLQPGVEQKFFYKDTKLTLHNKQGSLTLINPYNRRTDFLAYAKVQEGEVFTHTGSNMQTSVQTGNPKKSKTKTATYDYDELFEIKGLVLSSVQANDLTFLFKQENAQEIRVKFDPEKHSFPMTDFLFKKGNKLLIRGIYLEEDLFLIEDFVLLQQNSIPQTFYADRQVKLNNVFLFFCAFLLGCVFCFIRKKLLNENILRY